MILTSHARLRLSQRFPHLTGVALVEEYEAALRHRATPHQMALIKSQGKNTKKAKFYVSPHDVVFVTAEQPDQDIVVVTVFAMPYEKPRITDRERKIRRVQPMRHGERRAKEKPWRHHTHDED